MPDRPVRDVLGEALVAPVWSNLPEETREFWRCEADFIIARLAEAGYRIVRRGR